MKKKLKSLFEYQEFENDLELNTLLEEVEDRYSGYTALADSELETATGGLTDKENNLKIGDTVTYNSENTTKTGIIEQINENMILVNGEWISINQINS